MGADLITYMLVWHGDIKKRFDAVYDYAAVLNKQALAARGEISDTLSGTILAEYSAGQFKAVPSPLQDVLLAWYDDGVEVEEALSFIIESTGVYQLGQNLCALLGEYRDENIREVQIGTETYTVLVTGGMSWGDEPESSGYQGIKALQAIGAFPILEVL